MDPAYFRGNVGPQDQFLFDVENSLFMPAGGNARYAPALLDVREIQPTTGSLAYNSTTVFEIDKIADQLEEILLECDISAVTNAGSGNTPSIVDGFGYALFQRIEVAFTSNNIEYIYPEWAIFKHRSYLNMETQAGWNELVKMNQAPATLTTLATTGFRLRVPIPTYWQFIRRHSPIIAALANRLKFIVQTRPLANLVSNVTTGTTTIQSTAAVVGTSTNGILRANLINTTGKERDTKTILTKEPAGVNYLIDDPQYHFDEVIPEGTTTYTLRLANFDEPISEIVLLIRGSGYNGTAGDANYTQAVQNAVVVPPATIEITSNGLELIRPQTIPYLQNYLFPRVHSAIPSAEQIVYSFAMAPEMKNAATGSINFGSLTNPTLNIVWASATPAAYSLTVMAVGLTWVQQQGGVLLRVFR